MSNDVVIYTERELTWDEQLEHILAEVASGRALNSVLRDDEGMPSPRAFWGRMMHDEALAQKVAHAREAGVEAIMEQVRDIADTPVEAVELEESFGPNGVTRKRSVKEALGHRRLQIETRLKYAAMIKPRKYGPKLDLTSDGEKLSSIADAIAEGNRRIEESRKD